MYEDRRIRKIMYLKTTRRSFGQHNFVQNALAPAHLHIYFVLSHSTSQRFHTFYVALNQIHKTRDILLNARLINCK